MTNRCPHCQKMVSSRAIACPHCKTALKALGHQGIPLHIASGDTVLCTTCSYHKDDSCNYPQRPLAKDCIMYVDIRIPQESIAPQSLPSTPWHRLTRWANRHMTALIIVGLLLVSLLMVL